MRQAGEMLEGAFLDVTSCIFFFLLNHEEEFSPEDQCGGCGKSACAETEDYVIGPAPAEKKAAESCESITVQNNGSH